MTDLQGVPRHVDVLASFLYLLGEVHLPISKEW